MPQLTMPNVGEGVTEGTVTRWLKHEGDLVALDELVVEIETDKAVVEIPSPYEGRLSKILVEEGATVPIGQPLADFDAARGSASILIEEGTRSPEPTTDVAQPPPAVIPPPPARVAQATPPVPAPTDASSANTPIITPEFPAAGATERPAVAATPTTRTVEESIAADADDVAQPHPAVTAPATNPAATEGTTRGSQTLPTEIPRERIRQYSPVVTRLAAENQIDLALVRGTGIEGRVTRQDVVRYIENPAANTVPPASHEGVVGAERRVAPPPPAVIAVGEPPDRVAQATPPASSPAAAQSSDAAPAPDARRIPLTPMRRTIAARMTESHTTIPAAWMSVEADVTGLVALRDRIKADFAATEGVSLTYMPFFVPAIVGALKRHPQVNASYADDGITLHAGQHIGIAVATDAGLVVPVIRDAGEKSIAGLAHEIDELAERARARKLTIDEMRGATLTIDNTGAFGSVLSMPILPVGQVAIITTESIRRELRPLDESGARLNAAGAATAFGVRAVMNLCVTIDHRALDGAEAGAFMRDVRERLEAYAADDVVY